MHFLSLAQYQYYIPYCGGRLSSRMRFICISRVAPTWPLLFHILFVFPHSLVNQRRRVHNHETFCIILGYVQFQCMPYTFPTHSPCISNLFWMHFRSLPPNPHSVPFWGERLSSRRRVLRNLRKCVAAHFWLPGGYLTPPFPKSFFAVPRSFLKKVERVQNEETFGIMVGHMHVQCIHNVFPMHLKCISNALPTSCSKSYPYSLLGREVVK